MSPVALLGPWSCGASRSAEPLAAGMPPSSPKRMYSPGASTACSRPASWKTGLILLLFTSCAEVAASSPEDNRAASLCQIRFTYARKSEVQGGRASPIPQAIAERFSGSHGTGMRRHVQAPKCLTMKESGGRVFTFCLISGLDGHSIGGPWSGAPPRLARIGPRPYNPRLLRV